MEALFLKVLNMSITASYVIVAVLFIRLLLRKTPKKYSYLLWSVVGFRLICPVSFSSFISIFSAGMFDMTAAQGGRNASLSYIPEDVGYMTIPKVNLGIPAASTIVSGSLPAATEAASANPLEIWITLGTTFWCIGIAALLVCSIITYHRLKRRLAPAVRMDEGTYESDKIRSPFILGCAAPKIYIPFGLGEQEKSYILRHENYHLQRRDHLVKPLAFLVLTVHWLNPLVWLAFALMSKDMEMSCDEEVLFEAGEEVRKDYSRSLLSFASNRRFPGASPLAFGETGIRQRVENVLNFRRPRTWVTMIAGLLCLVAVVACAANPKEGSNKVPRGSASGVYEHLGIAVPLPEDYQGKVGLTPVDELEEGVIIEAYHLASREQHSEPEFKFGFLFRIVRHTPAEFEDYWVAYEGPGGANHFAKNDDYYYSYEFATDVQSADGYYEEYASLLHELRSHIVPAVIEENGLTAYDHSAVTGAEYTYPGNHATVKFALSDGTEAQLVLSQPVRQGDTGIWRAERWTDAYSSTYFILPETDKTALEYYSDLQEECDNGHRPGLLDPENVALEYITGVLGQSATRDSITILFTDNTGSIDLTDLDACVSAAILSENANKYKSGDFAAEAHTVLKTVESGNTTTVYAMVLYQEYGYSGGGFSNTSGSHGPKAITFERNVAGEYELKEYWRPKDGAGYAPSIKEKFPADIYEDALDTQKYILAHIQDCYEKAVEYGGVDVDAVIGKILETICSSPAEASNPWVYIDAHPIEYRKLLYYGDHTLRYVFAEFLEGGQTGLKGHIMLAAMRELIGGEDMSLEVSTAQEWFDEWKDHAMRMRDANSMEYMVEHAPKAYILLQMLNETGS